jgi:hypothetical protein
MPEKTPVRVNYTGSTATGLAEYQVTEYIPAKHGGTDNIGVSNAEVLVGNAILSDPKYIRKRILGTDNQISIFTSTLKIIIISQPVAGGTPSNFFDGETIYQGSINSPSATGVVVTGTNDTSEFTVHHKTGEFIQGGSLFAQNSLVDSNTLRTATILTSVSPEPITEEQEMTFKLGTFSISSQDYVIDCGELTGL